MKVIYEDENVAAFDKPAGINADDIPLRVHRLDKNTSGILLVAKNKKTLEFLQKQFQNRAVNKKYIALVTGNLKKENGVIETLLGRSPKDKRKQKVCLPQDPKAKGKREAVTEYRVLRRFKISAGGGSAFGGKDVRHRGGEKCFSYLEVEPKTGRKHQIRAHMAHLGHPIAGDKLYGFKNQPILNGLKRQFLHASYLKIKLPGGETKEFISPLPKDLKLVLSNLQPDDD